MTDTALAVPAADAPQAKPRLYLVDGSGFIFRAFHALPMMSRPDGTPVNAVLGFCNMLVKLRAEMRADYVAVIFDAARKTFRSEIYADYKAQRPEAPEELKPQFALIREAVRAFNVSCIELDGYEADDLIAAYACRARDRGWEVVVVSSDKDLMQLVGNGVEMFDPLKNKPIGPAEVMEKFGVPPEKVVDVQALAGDSVDNVPGVPGIGVKTAAQLITEYGDLETLLARAGEIKQPKRRELLLTHAEQARISKRLVTLDCEAPLPEDLDSLLARPPEREALFGFLRTNAFRALITKLESTIAAGPAPGPDAPPPNFHADRPEERAAAAAAAPRPDRSRYELVQTLEHLDTWIAECRAAGVVAFDTETDSLNAATATLVGLSLATAPGRACYVPFAHAEDKGDLPGLAGDAPVQIPVAEAVARLKPLLEDERVLKIGHNIKFDLQVMAQHGVAVAPYDDTLLMSYVLSGAGRGHGMDELSATNLGHTTITYDEVTGTGRNRITFDRVPLDKAKDYAAEDADVTLCLWHAFKPRLVRERAEGTNPATIYETQERPLAAVVAAMEREGVLVDVEFLRRLSGEFAERLKTLEAQVHELAGGPFNLGSPKQLGEVLFDKLGLPGGKKGKTGAYSTDVSVLEPLAREHAVVARLMDWRQLSKLKSTYTDALVEQIDPRTGRVHTSFAMASTNTGRFSSTDPNLQNIPIRTEEGRKIRQAFIAKPGHVLLSVDYSQIELRLIAEMAGVEALKEAFHQNVDIHALTASQVFGVPLEKMTPDLRRKAKAINFGIVYGISGFGLAQQIGVSQPEAASYIKQYLDRFHEIRSYMNDTKQFCRDHGYVVTLFGRRCAVEAIRDPNPSRRAGAERQAINAPIQGTAADILKRAMVRIPAALEGARLGARMLLTVHDELVFEVPEAEAEATAAVVKATMEGAVRLGVPLVAEAGWGSTWGAAH